MLGFRPRGEADPSSPPCAACLFRCLPRQGCNQRSAAGDEDSPVRPPQVAQAVTVPPPHFCDTPVSLPFLGLFVGLAMWPELYIGLSSENPLGVTRWSPPSPCRENRTFRLGVRDLGNLGGSRVRVRVRVRDELTGHGGPSTRSSRQEVPPPWPRRRSNRG